MGGQDPEDPSAQRRRQRPTSGPPEPQGGPSAPGLPFSGVPPRATEVQIDFDDIHNRARQLTNSREGIGAATLSPDARTAVYTMTVGNGANMTLDVQYKFNSGAVQTILAWPALNASGQASIPTSSATAVGIPARISAARRRLPHPPSRIPSTRPR